MADFFQKVEIYYRQHKKLVQYSVIAALILLNIYLVILVIFEAIPKKTVLPGTEKAEVKVKGVIEVLNGSGKRGYNEKIVDFLRQKGMDVVHSSNYRLSNVPETIIILRNDNSIPAYYIASLLSIDSARVVNIRNKDLYLDATVILGKDISYKTY